MGKAGWYWYQKWRIIFQDGMMAWCLPCGSLSKLIAPQTTIQVLPIPMNLTAELFGLIIAVVSRGNNEGKGMTISRDEHDMEPFPVVDDSTNSKSDVASANDPIKLIDGGGL